MVAKRPTISDIAKAAGVSTGAVSYALNNRPGVSEPTRRRIMDIADRLGWVPSSAARSLSDGRANAIGLVVDRPARVCTTSRTSSSADLASSSPWCGQSATQEAATARITGAMA